MPLHPRFVHFPIALLFVGVALIMYTARWRNTYARKAGWLNLLLGWIALFPTIVTGLIDQNRLEPTPEVTSAVNRHITGGILLLVIFGGILYARLRNPTWDDPDTPLPAYVPLLMGIGLAILILTGEIGGQLAYVFR